MLKLSQTSKLGCKSWSLEAVTTCPGSKAEDGGLVPACQGCYARGGNYRFPNVKAPRLHNQEDWQRASWEDDMVDALQTESEFRWFDSGDCYAIKLAQKMFRVMVRTPHVRHWFPTRMYKFKKFQAILDEMNALPNVVVRFSSDSVTGHYGPEHGSTILPSADVATSDVHVCRAYENGGKCGSCRACWNKNIPVIGYVAHGKTMQKVIKLHLAA